MANVRKDISIVAIIKNEAFHLRRHLPIWTKVCEDIVLVDSGSTDQSKEIALEYNCTWVESKWLGYGETKNVGNKHAKNEWILSLDADEIPDEDLKLSLSCLNLRRGIVYEVNRLTSYCGQFIYHCGWHPMPLLRIFHKDEWHWNENKVHEKLQTHVSFEVQKLKGKLLHFSFTTEEQHKEKLQNYARLQAQSWVTKGEKPSFGRKIIGPVGRFLTTYFFKLGFLDGTLGFKICKNEAKMVIWQVEEWYKLKKNSS